MSRRWTLRILAGLLAATAAAGKMTAADWPEFHGPKRDNLSQETGLLAAWPEGGPTRLWTATGLGKGYSLVAIADGTIYTSGILEGKTHVLALDLDGKLRWKSANGIPWKAAKWARFARGYNGARSTPTVDGGRVYQLNELGRLAALDAKTGTEHWAVDLTERFDARPPQWAYAESVLIDGDRLFCYPGGKKGSIVALDKKTGRTLWANEELTDPPTYCSPVLVEDRGVRQLISMSALAVFAVRPETGKLLWRVPHTNRRKINVTTPVYHDGRVFVSNGYGGGSISVALSFGNGAIRAKKAWESAVPDNHHGGVVLVDGHVYGSGHYKKGWACLDFQTGRVLWRHEHGKGSVTYAGGMLYVLDEKGTMSLVKPSPKGYEEVSSFRVPKGGEGLYWPHPVVCGGRLYVRHADRLFCYDVKAGP
jgi:outer membrane protein assembly factor BamB